MAIADWKVALEDLGLSAPTPTDAPAERSGSWLNVRSSFERRGFSRILVSESDDSLEWYLESAHPALDEACAAVAAAAMERASGGEFESESLGPNHFALIGTAAQDATRSLLIPLLLFADAAIADRDDLGDLQDRLAAVESPDAQSGDESSDSEGADEAQDVGEGDENISLGSDEEADSDSESPFEAIGDEAAVESAQFELHVLDDSIELGMGLPDLLDADTFDAVVQGWGRSLRGRYDVRTAPIAPDDESRIDLTGSRTRIMLRVTPDALTGTATVADIAPGLEDHVDTLQKISAGGIDPLVFLGVRTRSSVSSSSKSASAGPFESIGDDEPASDDDDDAPSVLFVDDSSPEEPDEGGLILDLSMPPEEGAALEPGRFDDPRLKGPDATTPLVDVVLRHPGYSDRSIGQVLSILLSVDYSDALELANSAPRVIAWGVGAQRAQTMKTVIEGAGGRVHLVEPDTFAPQ